MDPKIQVCQAEVLSNERKAKNIWELKLDPRLDLHEDDIFMPGQFVCLEPLDPASTMARPFSISYVSMSSGTFKLLYKVVGKNTELMTGLNPGQQIKFWGPLGQEFLPDSLEYGEVWLVGGGIGIAPLIYYEKAITELQGGTARVFYGSKTKEEVIPLDLYTREPLVIATDDGSAGFPGFVPDLINGFLKGTIREKVLVITCGPNIMMKRVAEICAERQIECHVILETIMACGLNNCKGCTIKTTSGMKSICHDGPVFPAQEVIWNEVI